jgi:hypothetical protein
MASSSPRWQTGQQVDPGTVLTQVGTVDSQLSGNWARHRFRFQYLLRTEQEETEMSCYVGRLTIVDAVGLISLGVRPVMPNDVVRYSQANALLNLGFSVRHTPDRIEEHVSITSAGDWDPSVGELFDGCFVEYVKGA